MRGSLVFRIHGLEAVEALEAINPIILEVIYHPRIVTDGGACDNNSDR